jgi:Fur family transcriptional regulator, peroxide stress response regulator
MKTSIEILKTRLLEKGIRPSLQRIKVLEYLYQVMAHPSADEIFANVSPQIPSLSKATVYNTLRSFAQAGLIRVISVDGLENRFDLTTSNHGHFKCDRCGTIFNFGIDIDSFPVDDLARFKINEKNVYFNGLCPNCLSLQKKE